MRNIFLFVLLMFYAAKLCGQAPVTDTSWLPDVGDKFYTYRISYTQYTNPFIDVIDTGENVNWDYSQKYFNLYNPDDSLIFTMPSSIPITPYNPEVNFAIGDLKNFGFYIKNEDGLFFTEGRQTNGSNVNPINHNIELTPHIVFKNNLRFRDTFYDTSMYVGFMSYDYSDTSYRGFSTSVIKYDSYGTLKVAGTQYNNVIRTFSKHHTKMVSKNEPDTSYFYTKVYEWHSLQSKYDLLYFYVSFEIKKKDSFYDTTYNGAGLILRLPTRLHYPYPPKIPSDEISAFFVNDVLNIKPYDDYGNTNYTLYDMQGRLLLQGNINLKYMQQEKMNIIPLPTGVYLLHLQNDNGLSRTFKLVK